MSEDLSGETVHAFIDEIMHAIVGVMASSGNEKTSEELITAITELRDYYISHEQANHPCSGLLGDIYATYAPLLEKNQRTKEIYLRTLKIANRDMNLYFNQLNQCIKEGRQPDNVIKE
jgi:hypothetical protein